MRLFLRGRADPLNRSRDHVFLSNRMGCLKSLLLSVVLTLVLLLVLGVIPLPGGW